MRRHVKSEPSFFFKKKTPFTNEEKSEIDTVTILVSYRAVNLEQRPENICSYNRCERRSRRELGSQMP